MVSSARAGVTDRLRETGIIPVIVIDHPADAPALATALIGGGLPCAEVTLRTPAALEAIRKIAESAPNLLLGAGTVLNPEQAADAVSAGAGFVVAPGFNRSVVDYCLERDVPVFPGVCTPTEIESALQAGVQYLKFFPAEAMGGVVCLKAISAPYRGVRFIPTGGITLSNVASYLMLDNVIACGGSWIAPSGEIAAGSFDAIRAKASAAVAEVLRARSGA